MRYFALLLMLLSCSPSILNPSNSKIAVLTYQNEFLYDNDVVYTNYSEKIKFIFLPYNSTGLTPKLYMHGTGKVHYTQRSPRKDGAFEPNIYYEVECIPDKEITLLFVYEGEQIGHKVLIHIILTK